MVQRSIGTASRGDANCGQGRAEEREEHRTRAPQEVRLGVPMTRQSGTAQDCTQYVEQDRRHGGLHGTRTGLSCGQVTAKGDVRWVTTIDPILF